MIELPVKKPRLREKLGHKSSCLENCRVPTTGLSVRTGNANSGESVMRHFDAATGFMWGAAPCRQPMCLCNTHMDSHGGQQSWQPR
jgi:hypothetical protein